MVNSATRPAVSSRFAILLALLGTLGYLSIPRFSGTPPPSANESAAISTLRSIHSAQSRFRAEGHVDRDGDGNGEYGTLGELAGLDPLRGRGHAAPLDAALLSRALGITDEAGRTARSGYLFQLHLPDADGHGLPVANASSTRLPEVDPDAAEGLWTCYAWPVDAGRSGRRAFFVDQRGDVYDTANRLQRYSGDGPGPNFDAALAGPGSIEGPVADGVAGRDGNLWRRLPRPRRSAR